jgi:hypothetical protein
MSNRITEKDLHKAIFKAPSKEALPAQSVIVFTVMGHEDELVDELGRPDKDGYPSLWDSEFEDGKVELAEQSRFAYAKINNGQRRRYFVKQDKRRHLVNPINGIDEFKVDKKNLKNPDDSHFSYREVGHKVFLSYLNFLKTKNGMFLTQAERELLS